jgi:hypothetical protein
MPFPDDLTDLLPLLPGDKLVRKLSFNGESVFVEIGCSSKQLYHLHIDLDYQGKTIRIFGTDRLNGEDEVESLWREFLEERRNILAHRPPPQH